MGSQLSKRIGKPLTEVVGSPRILPKTLPRPAPPPLEVPVKEKEKVPVPAKSVYEQAYTATERAITGAADFLGISEQRVADIALSLIDKALWVFELKDSKKSKAESLPT